MNILNKFQIRLKKLLKKYIENIEGEPTRAYLAEELGKLHSHVMRMEENRTYELNEELDSLKTELSQLHNLTVNRHEEQLQFLNKQIYDLKRSLYHNSFPEIANAFNGQFSKQKIFTDLCNVLTFDVFIETGSYLGKTTKFLSSLGKPVYSVEINEEFHKKAIALLSDEKLTNIELGDSIQFLNKLTKHIIPKQELAFIYLDAHWYNHLPLREEIILIATNHPYSIVMIDDFKVEDDNGYGYDSYEDGQEVTLNFLRKELRTHNWQVFFPSMPSKKDHITNDILPPRGTAILACDPELIHKLESISNLRHFPC